MVRVKAALMNNHQSLFFFLFIASKLVADPLEKPMLGVIIVPIADAVGLSLYHEFGQPDVSCLYEDFAYAPQKGWSGCARMHQFKYNEVVALVPYGISKKKLSRQYIKSKERTKADKKSGGGEIECKTTNLFYIDGRGKNADNFWLLKKYIIPLSELDEKIDRAYIPKPIDKDGNANDYNRNVLTLALPWFDLETKSWYSAGTRFIRCPDHDSATMYAVYFVDYCKPSIHIKKIARQSAIVSYPKTDQAMRHLFLKLLKRWARETNEGSIPYVFGGSSFTKRYPHNGFSLQLSERNGRAISYWQRQNDEKPSSGFDCSGVLLTAAQSAGIPFFFKNTGALSRCHEKLLKKGDKLQEGDLVWYSGHVLIISDLQKNLLIEAAGYQTGHGKLHEIKVDKVFMGIQSLEHLVKAYHAKKFLRRLNSVGKPFRSIYTLKIFKLL